MAEYSKHDGVRYLIETAEGDREVVAALAGYTGWFELGEFSFDAGIEYAVSVYDNYSYAVEDDQHLTADALRLINETPTMPTMTPMPNEQETMSPAPEPTPQSEPPTSPSVEDPAMEMPSMPTDEPVTPLPSNMNNQPPSMQDDTNAAIMPTNDSTPSPPQVSYVRMEGGCDTAPGAPTVAAIWMWLVGLMLGLRSRYWIRARQ